ncbi:hypothetical protein AMECASPLE_025950 [Ameca splendens]|uniref:Uncharacterized protein n=1 Tax=Ameca splendens TaxID=208324 RepID=A0ABV0Y5C1_9TELE
MQAVKIKCPHLFLFVSQQQKIQPFCIIFSKQKGSKICCTKRRKKIYKPENEAFKTWLHQKVGKSTHLMHIKLNFKSSVHKDLQISKFFPLASQKQSEKGR